jgi:S-formylglutathione hydrolase FrmB
MNVIPMYLQELRARQAQPAVLVMPDTDGGLQYEMQCLNDPGGLQDMTFVGQEVPRWVSANLRAQPPGLMWGVAGYSEGGFCAANIALQYASDFGYAGSLSGYFAPVTSRVSAHGEQGAAPVNANVFARMPALGERNSPQRYVLNVPLAERVPQFYLAAGVLDPADVSAAQYFRQLLLTRVAQVPLMIVPGGGHQATVWRAALRPMLAWMTTQLAITEQRSAVAARNAAAGRSRHPRHGAPGKHPLKARPRLPAA